MSLSTLLRSSYFTAIVAALLSTWAASTCSAATVSGELVKWHTVVVDFAGPAHDEMDSDPNPFLDYRLQVEFTSSASGRVYNVAGFFDGDGNGGRTGNVWRVRFTPDQAGVWTYFASFRSGSEVAVALNPGAGSPTSFDGESGTFEVAPLDPNAEGFKRLGRLEWDGTHYLKFRDGGYWIKMGTNVPENFLGYTGFDSTPNALLDFSAHESDWQPGDPAWDSPDGPDTNDARGIIGALNYLAAENINSIYFMPMNIGADAEDTWPYADPNINRAGSPSNDNLHFDISKLAQWEVVLDHAQRKSIFLHFVLSDKEAANKNELDNTALGVERKLFYRELAARFGHHNALQWNVCEEYNLDLPLSPDVIKEWAGYMNAVDGYEHPVTAHNHGNTYISAITPFVGDDRFDVLSIQTWQRPDDISDVIEHFREESEDIGRPVPVNIDESIGLDQLSAAEYRKRAPWDAVLSGGGHELFNRIDWRLDDFTPYQQYFEESWFARRFVEDNLPFWDMLPADDLLTGENDLHGGGEVFAQAGEVYAVYLPQADSSPTLSMPGASGEFEQHWYNPRTGQFEGPVTIFDATSSRDLGTPPSDTSDDWAVLIRRADTPDNIPPVAMNTVVTIDEDESAPITLMADDDDGDPLTFSISMTPLHGNLSGLAPNITYTPSADYYGSDQIAFQVSDGRGGNDMGSVSITVAPINDRPTASGVAASTFEEQSVDITLNGDDVDGDPFGYVITTAPSNGSLSTVVGDQVTYTPDPGFFGSDSFGYASDDGLLQSTEATVDINVIEATGSNVLFFDDFSRSDDGALGNGWAELEEPGAHVEIAAGRLHVADASDAFMRPLASHTFPGLSQGSLVWSFDMDWVRDRKEGAYGVYMQLGSAGAMTTSDLDAGAGVNLVWTRIDGTHQMLGHQSGGSPTALALVSGPAAVLVNVDLDGGTFTVAVDGEIVATQLPLSAVGPIDTVRYFTDGLNEEYFSGRAFDNVMVATDSGDPNPPNTDPVADADSITTPENTPTPIVLTASDDDGDTLSFSVVADPSSGVLTGVAPNLVYTPNADFVGDDSFTFEVDDGNGGTAQAVVDIEVTEAVAINTFPVADDDTATVDEDDSVDITLSASDDDGDPLTFFIVEAPSHGALTGTPPDLTYTPAANYAGPDSLTFQVSDGRGGSDQAEIAITVTALNDVPTASDAAVAATSGSSITIALAASDVETAALTYQIVSLPTSGSLGGTADGDDMVTYTSAAGFVGTDSFTFVASDGLAPSNEATVTIEVRAVPTTTELFTDDFERSDGTDVGNGWSEFEEAGSHVEIAAGKLFFLDTSDAAMRPAATHGFAPTSTGQLTWTFTMDWTRYRKESDYAVFMQLGSSASMSADDADAGVAVNLIWSRIDGTHQSLGTRTAGENASVGVISGTAVVEVVADLDAGTYRLSVDGAPIAEGVALSPTGPIDTLRFATDGLNENHFLGRSFDDVSIVSE